MKIEILGMGCAKCKQLYKNADLAVHELKADAELVKVEDIGKITEYGIMTTPAIAVDGKVLSTGKLLTKDEII